jgi:NAD(P)-dependent dehydrogenase (short-subunit alcohol dehydrogenase family)
LGTPEEVAEAVRYVILDAPAYLTGARIAVDGGAEALA